MTATAIGAHNQPYYQPITSFHSDGASLPVSKETPVSVAEDASRFAKLDNVFQQKPNDEDKPLLRAAEGGQHFDLWAFFALLQQSNMDTYRQANEVSVQSTRIESNLTKSQADSKRTEGNYMLYGAIGAGAAGMALIGFGAARSIKGSNKTITSVGSTKAHHASADKALNEALKTEGADLSRARAEREVTISNARYGHEGAMARANRVNTQGDAIRHSNGAASGLVDGIQRNATSGEQANQRLDEVSAQVAARIAQSSQANRSASEEQLRQAASTLDHLSQAQTQVMDSVAAATRF